MEQLQNIILTINLRIYRLHFLKLKISSFSFFISSSSFLSQQKKKKKMFRQSVSIDLVEPMVCLRGQPNDKQTVNIIRGAIRLQLSHAAIVHSITVQFTGTSKTLWPECNNNKKS